jgi:hypothetical protein
VKSKLEEDMFSSRKFCITFLMIFSITKLFELWLTIKLNGLHKLLRFSNNWEHT